MSSFRHTSSLLVCVLLALGTKVYGQRTSRVPIATSAPRAVLAATTSHHQPAPPPTDPVRLGVPSVGLGRPTLFAQKHVSAPSAPIAPLISGTTPLPFGGEESTTVSTVRAASPASDVGVRRVGFEEPKSGEVFPRYVIRGQSPTTSYQPSGPPPVPPPGSGSPEYNFPVPPGQYNSDVDLSQPYRENFWDKCKGWFGGSGFTSTGTTDWFRSCGCNTGITSPVTNPFFFEDPRSLTELRPVIIYQTASDRNPVMRGGDSEYFGLQARVALSESFSIVMNKLGFVAIQPDSSGMGFDDEFGFAEINIGGKWTFLRNEEAGRYAAAGMNFQIPVGSSSVFQDTGDLGLAPYISFAQRFGRSSFGAFNFVSTAGYSFSTSDSRSEFFHSSFHLSYDIARMDRFFPLLEVNYFHYTKFGDSQPFTFEGTDLVNFGSSAVPNRDILTIAPGFRYKFSETTQFGFGAEWTLTNQENALRDLRLTFDVIFRY